MCSPILSMVPKIFFKLIKHCLAIRPGACTDKPLKFDINVSVFLYCYFRLLKYTNQFGQLYPSMQLVTEAYLLNVGLNIRSPKPTDEELTSRVLFGN